MSEIKLNYSALGEFLDSKEVADLLLEVGEGIASKANETMPKDDEYRASKSKGNGKRARVGVVPVTVHAARSNNKHNTLAKVLSGWGQ